jgi:hypothetical protein
MIPIAELERAFIEAYRELHYMPVMSSRFHFCMDEVKRTWDALEAQGEDDRPVAEGEAPNDIFREISQTGSGV